MKKILVPIDFSDVTKLVIENAKLFAKALNAELKVIHVLTPTVPRVQEAVGGVIVAPMNYEVLRDDLAAELRNEHKKMLEIKKNLSTEKIRVTSFLLEGNISQVIFSQIEEYDPDIIVMGSHGHGYMMKALLGSIAMSVLKHVKCPVIIVPSKTKKKK